jgi:tetratricopeptide (TPR) repeat protein
MKDEMRSSDASDLDSAGQELLTRLADSFVAQYRRGEHPSIEECAKQHPSLSEQIRQLFPAMLMMEQQQTVGSAAAAATTNRHPAPGQARSDVMVGRYKLLERIGEGGFGVVYMAEQQQPVRRKVALKVIKAGMDSRQVIARFDAERQALAMMDHPNIAKVLDGGTTDSGRPYFVMELVPGVSITEYCDQKKLSPRERLELFVQVCQAVQHAHQKGIIHRDLKPSNVLVTVQDDKLVPKVIDFGVAKATGQQLTDMTLFTNLAQLVGTPLYMSPEQAQMGGVDVDTRSDVYSLGVLLYELLTGSTPFDRSRLGKAALDEVRRIIREEEPPRPSTRLSTAAALPSIAACRSLEPKRLSGLVRGELDWIVMKCLEKDRARRYETANGLARDVERYLGQEAVHACPPTRGYRFRKFARRNKAALLAVSAAVAVLLVLVAGLAVSNGIIAAERNQKTEALKDRERALAVATAESNRSRKNFVAASVAIREVLTKAALGNDEWAQLPVGLRRIFSDEALKFYGSLLQEDSSDPSLRYETGVGYRSMALLHDKAHDPARAEECYRKALAILGQLTAADSADVQSRQQLAWANFLFGTFLTRAERTKEANACLHSAVDLYVKLISDVPASVDYRNQLGKCLVAWQSVGDVEEYEHLLAAPQRADLRYAHGLALAQARQPEKAALQFREVRAEYGKLAAESPAMPEYAFLHANSSFQLAQCLSQTDKAAEAEHAYGESITILQLLAEQWPAEPRYRVELGRTRNWLGFLLARTARRDLAELEHRKAVDIYQKLVRETQPAIATHRRELAWSRLNLVRRLMDNRRTGEAEKELKAVIELCEPLEIEFPADKQYAAWIRDACRQLRAICAASNRPDEANGWLSREIKAAGSDAVAHKELAEMFLARGMLPEAEARAREAVRLRPDYAVAFCRLGQVFQRQGNGPAAVAALNEAQRLLDENAGKLANADTRVEQGHAMWDLSDSWLQLNRPEDAEHASRGALKIFTALAAAFPATAFYRQEQAFSYRKLADVAVRAGRKDDVEAHLREAVILYRKLSAEQPSSSFYAGEVAVTLGALTDLLLSTGKFEAAEPLLLAQGRDLDTQLSSQAGPWRENVRRVTKLYKDWNKPEKLSAWRAESLAALERGISRAPEDLQLRVTRGNLLLDAGEHQKAEAEFSKVIDAAPQMGDAWTGRAFSHFHRQQWEEAVADFTRATECSPNVHTNWFHRGHVYRALAQWDKAAADFAKVTEKWPDDPGGWILLGATHAQMNEPEKAITDLRQAIARGFHDAEQIKADPSFESLRSNDDFKKLMAGLEGQVK